jgi:uncharacterized membrane protein
MKNILFIAGLFLGALIMGAGMYNVCEMIIWHGVLWPGFIITFVGLIISVISFQNLINGSKNKISK